MAQLIVTQSHDYRGETLTDITEIVFNAFGSLFATFGSNQFGGTGISNTVMITGDLGSQEHIEVILSAPGTFSAAGWTFSSGFEPVFGDTIRLIGTSGADTITGTSLGDSIVGGAGADVLNGGDGDDAFVFFDGEAAPGEVVDGGAGEDVLSISENIPSFDPVTADFSGTTLNSVEHLRFFRTATVTFTDAQAGAFETVSEQGGFQRLIVNGSSIDLSGVDFIHWGNVDTPVPPPVHPQFDTVELNGTAGADSITGSEVDDIITAGAGADTVNGGAGRDLIIHRPGDGADTLVGFTAGITPEHGRPVDQVDITAFGPLGTFADLLERITQNGADAVLVLGGGDTITFQNVQKTSLAREDFVGVRTVRQDVNGEGRADIVWQHDSGAKIIWDGANPSEFQSSDGPLPPARFEGVGDFHGDGTAGLLWRTEFGNLQLEDNFHTHFVAGPSNDWDIADVGYFDSDATTDILWQHDSGQLAIWKINDGEQSGYHFLGGVGPDWTLTDTGDFNGDGQTDILWRHATGAAAIWDTNNGAQSGYHFLGPVGNDWSVADIGDFNGDRTEDILWQHDSGALAIWDMNGGQQSGYHFLGFVDGDWTLADTNDYNGDGQTDILWRHHAGAVAVWDINNSQQSGYHFLGHVGNEWHVL